ncbi:MAG: hypothetical protein PWP24_1206 [Clostridiales bacterium]|nr:hypothetical protein [Clostridiales bacterium]
MQLLPQPQRIQFFEGEFIIRYETAIVIGAASDLCVYDYAKLLQKEIKETLGLMLPIRKQKSEEANVIFLDIRTSYKKNEYEINITKDGICLYARDNQSLLYAVQTLRQIVIQKGALLPALTIFDYPKILNRGYYFDVTRGRVPTLEGLKALADKMSFYKLNQLQLYVEHSFLFRDFSEVWRDDTPLTAQDIMELDAYCRTLHIELIPSLASFGHLHKVLSTKTYRDLCELEGSDEQPFSYCERMEHHTIDVSNEKSVSLIKAMLLEYMPLFSSKRFNICADETFDLGKGKNKERAAQVGIERLYLDFLKQLCEFLQSQGKQPMFWGDILLKQPEMIKELPSNSICLNWDYNAQGTDSNVAKLQDLGAKQYVCPGVHGWRRLINSYEDAYANIKRMAGYAHTYQTEGLLNTDWGDYGHINHPEFSTTGMIYGAAFSWKETDITFEEINQAISGIEYRDTSRMFVTLINRIAKQDRFIWNHAVSCKEYLQGHKNMEQIKKELEAIGAETFESANEAIDQAVYALYQILPLLQQTKQSIVKPYLVAAKGIQIFNRIGMVMTAFLCEGKELYSQRDLASQLEYWFMEYKGIWREHDQESELYRIMEVITWYADFLRQNERGNI